MYRIGISFVGQADLRANGGFAENRNPIFYASRKRKLPLIPVVGIGYAQLSSMINKGPFTLSGARVIGIVLSGICLFFFASVLFFPSA